MVSRGALNDVEDTVAKVQVNAYIDRRTDDSQEMTLANAEKAIQYIDLEASLARLNELIDSAARSAGITVVPKLTVRVELKQFAGASATSIEQEEANSIAQEVWHNEEWVVPRSTPDRTS